STMAFGVGGLIVLLGVLGYTFRNPLFPQPRPQPPVVIVDTTNKNKKTPDQISRENEDRVVQIEFSWELFDANSGDQLWPEYVAIPGPGGQRRYAALFIQNTEGQTEPYIDVQKRVQTGLPVGGNNSMGSGFVVSG